MDQTTLHSRKQQTSHASTTRAPTDNIQEAVNASSTTNPDDDLLSKSLSFLEQTLFLHPYQLIAFVFPLTLVFGCTYGYFNTSPSIFSNKRNLLNVIFAKNAWGWTSLVFFFYIAVFYGSIFLKKPASSSEGRQNGNNDGNEGNTVSHFDTSTKISEYIEIISKAAIRWAIATSYWWIISRWFFGPSLFDRVYVITGGSCSVNGHFTQQNCRRQGGLWAGGFDVSGHVFLLSHACLFLLEELSVFLNSPRLWNQAMKRPMAKFSVLSALGLSLLWWVMLFYTCVYHHHLLESVTGLIVGMAFWLGTYVTSYKRLPFPFMPDQTLEF
ncbi:hypothetical protein BGZ76_001951 [Entomortierella beljakovae]|nr:hypothetical protein BGZ76_001951 [Entomortierella beljakovae]